MWWQVIGLWLTADGDRFAGDFGTYASRCFAPLALLRADRRKLITDNRQPIANSFTFVLLIVLSVL
jgi:hypothetical protein